ncbi:MAG: polysaccharide pyruvyl transferase family protein, partial [bacterium]|nr:polysaccharide pyruvyl transferase family protein [bacterium]
MEVHYFHGKHPNFGDDLNATLWQHVLPAAICETDDILLFGVGSILNEERISIFRNDRRRKIILGSGTSYGSPP